MSSSATRRLNEKIKECRQLLNPAKVILCLEELLKSSNDGMVAYAMGHEYEKLGDIMSALKYYEKAEALFKEINFKNMARSAINNLQIESILGQRRKEKLKGKR
jgi:tetratricopeptide (TPR) repeat protein